MSNKNKIKTTQKQTNVEPKRPKEHISLYARSWEIQYRPKSTIRIIQKGNNLIKILNAHKALRPKQTWLQPNAKIIIT